MSLVRKYAALFLSLLLAAMGISLQLKAMIGVAPFDALNQTLSFVTGMRVGDIVMLLNIVFIALQVLLLGKDTHWRIFLQVLIGTFLGQFVNFFYYFVFDALVLDNYLVQLLVFILGCFWVPFFMSGIMVLDLVTMPVENLAMILSQKTKFSFGIVRQSMDILFVILALTLTFIYSQPLTIREGTIISALTFGPLFSVFMPKIEEVFVRWGLVEEPAEQGGK